MGCGCRSSSEPADNTVLASNKTLEISNADSIVDRKEGGQRNESFGFSFQSYSALYWDDLEKSGDGREQCTGTSLKRAKRSRAEPSESETICTSREGKEAYQVTPFHL